MPPGHDLRASMLLMAKIMRSVFKHCRCLVTIVFTDGELM